MDCHELKIELLKIAVEATRSSGNDVLETARRFNEWIVSSGVVAGASDCVQAVCIGGENPLSVGLRSPTDNTV